MAVLELPEADETDMKRERMAPSDPDYLPATHRLLHVLAERTRWRAALADARHKVSTATGNLSGT